MSRYKLLQGLLWAFHCGWEDSTGTHKRDNFSFLLLFYLICSVLEFHGPNNGTTLRYSFSLWVQPTNTNVIPLQIGLKYTHTQSLSLSQAPSTKTHCSHTHTQIHTEILTLSAHTLLLAISLSDTHIHKRIHSQEKKKQSIIHFRAFHIVLFITLILKSAHLKQEVGRTITCLACHLFVKAWNNIIYSGKLSDGPVASLTFGIMSKESILRRWLSADNNMF